MNSQHLYSNTALWRTVCLANCADGEAPVAALARRVLGARRRQVIEEAAESSMPTALLPAGERRSYRRMSTTPTSMLGRSRFPPRMEQPVRQRRGGDQL